MRKSLIAATVAALAVAGLGAPAAAEVVAPSPLATITDYEPFSSAANQPEFWESEGVTCTKDESVDGQYDALLPALPAGQSYAQVIVKAASDNVPGPNTIFGEPEAGEYVWADTNADGIYNPGGEGGDKQISHIITCVSWNVLVTKSATPTYTRTWQWSATKGAFNPITRSAITELLLDRGQQFSVEYDINLSAVPADSAFKVVGDIVIDNPSPFTATVTGVSDLLSDGTVGAVTCPDTYPFDIAAGGSVTCTYTADLLDADDLTNTATVTTSGLVGGGSDDAAVDFGEPTTKVKECVTVSDVIEYGANAGSLLALPVVAPFSTGGDQVCVTDLLTRGVTSYEVAVPTAECGPALLRNTLTVDGVAYRVDVLVDVPCDTGCTLTQGYWKTHSEQGPAPYDDGWGLIGELEEDTPFFNSGKTWLEVFRTPPAGNAYYNLAHQYMAAKLNLLNGASSTPEVDAAILAAEAIFAGLPGDVIARADKAEAVGLAGILGGYNEGLVGPGHCDQ